MFAQPYSNCGSPSFFMWPKKNHTINTKKQTFSITIDILKNNIRIKFIMKCVCRDYDRKFFNNHSKTSKHFKKHTLIFNCFVNIFSSFFRVTKMLSIIVPFFYYCLLSLLPRVQLELIFYNMIF